MIDELKTPVDGSTVLIDVSGVPEWGVLYSYPLRIVTEEDLLFMGDLLDDVTIVGIVTHEVMTMSATDGCPF